MVYRDRNGKRIRESTFTEDWQEAQRKLAGTSPGQGRQHAGRRPERRATTFSDWADFFLENYSKPPIRAAEDPRSQRTRVIASQASVWETGGWEILPPMTSSSIFEGGLRQRVQVRTAGGVIEKDRVFKADNSPSGIADSSPDDECRSSEEIACRRIPVREWSFPCEVKGCSVRTTWHGPSSSGSSSMRPSTCAMSSGSSGRPDFGCTRN